MKATIFQFIDSETNEILWEGITQDIYADLTIIPDDERLYFLRGCSLYYVGYRVNISKRGLRLYYHEIETSYDELMKYRPIQKPKTI